MEWLSNDFCKSSVWVLGKGNRSEVFRLFHNLHKKLEKLEIKPNSWVCLSQMELFPSLEPPVVKIPTLTFSLSFYLPIFVGNLIIAKKTLRKGICAKKEKLEIERDIAFILILCWIGRCKHLEPWSLDRLEEGKMPTNFV